MAASGMYLTHDANGKQNREDLLDLISNMSASDTPVFTMLGKTATEGVYHNFLSYETPRPTTNGATAEGADVSFGALPSPTRNVNYVQEITQGYSVSYVQEKTKQAGPGSLAWQRKEAMKTWKMQMERSIIFNTGNSGASGTAREMKGLLNGGAITKTTNASGATLSETNFNNYLQSIWNDTDMGTYLTYLDVRLKRHISANFITSTVKNMEKSDISKLSTKISAYESDVADTTLISHRDLNGSSRFFTIAKEAYKVGIFDTVKDIDATTHTANGYRGKIYGSGTLEFLYPKASVSVTNLA